MPDLDTQLQALADHRLAQVPEFITPAPEDENETAPAPGRRRLAFLAAAAAIVVAVVATGLFIIGGDSADVATPDLELGIADRDVVERDDWSTAADIATPSTFVVAELGVGDPIQAAVVDRANTRFRPASTFKLLNALILLEAGVVQDMDEVVEWDGVDRPIADWNRDLTLAEAIEVSAVWVFESLSDQIDVDVKATALTEADYGNADAGDGTGAYWLDGPLTISALEQLVFLDQLVARSLPHPADDQAAVLDAMAVVQVDDTRIRYKTGTALRGPEPVAWLIGVADNDRGTWVFALNADLPTDDTEITTEQRLDAAITFLTDAGAIGG